ncbi:diacylglycerol/lipid kinase family protein [Kytococcus sedentarius]|uniref:diacylglycerol/lipid kinase family protein n=1 Tax=Kytococcus sedentarius TaxID=1276 RepID=UPI0035BC0DAC
MRRLTLIVNPSSGGGRALVLQPAVVAALEDAGFVVETHRSTSLGHVRRIVAGSTHPVAVLGGDGTLGHALAGALHSGVPVVPLPGGRGNDLCRALGVRGSAAQVAGRLGGMRERRIDLGDVAGRPFAGVLSIGLDAVASEAANRTRVPGTLAYVWGAVQALLVCRPLALRVTVDGVATEHRAWFCSVSNSGWFGGGKNVAPAGSIDDGQLDVVVAEDMSRLRLVQVLLGLFTGAHVRMRGVTVRTGREVVVEQVGAARPAPVRADGEELAHLPVRVTVRRRAARVLVPDRT